MSVEDMEMLGVFNNAKIFTVTKKVIVKHVNESSDESSGDEAGEDDEDTDEGEP